jgi:hypothetical protein
MHHHEARMRKNRVNLLSQWAYPPVISPCRINSQLASSAWSRRLWGVAPRRAISARSWKISAASRAGGRTGRAESGPLFSFVQAQRYSHGLADGIGRREPLLFHLTLQRLDDVPLPNPPTAALSASGFSLHPSQPRNSSLRQGFASGSATTWPGRWRGASLEESRPVRAGQEEGCQPMHPSSDEVGQGC